MSELDRWTLKVDGFRSGIALEHGIVHLWNKGANSDHQWPVSEIRGITYKPMGAMRGYIHIQVAGGTHAPSGSTAAVKDPYSISLSMTAGKNAKRFEQLVSDHLAENPPPALDPPPSEALDTSAERTDDTAHETSKDDKWSGLRPDIAAAARQMSWTMGGKREIRHLEQHLETGEAVSVMAQGTFGENQGIAVLTDRRLVFVFQGFVRSSTEEFSLDVITAVETSKTLGAGTLRLRMSGNSAEIKAVVLADLQRMTEAIRQRISRTASLTSVVPAPEDAISQIKRLGELRDSGLLSDEEFAGKKQELLKRL